MLRYAHCTLGAMQWTRTTLGNSRGGRIHAGTWCADIFACVITTVTRLIMLEHHQQQKQ